MMSKNSNRQEIKKLSPSDKDYPQKLKEFLKDPRPIYYIGDISMANRPSVAIVGSRVCSSYGRTVATEIGRRAAAFGVQVVSGLAKGIDAAGHLGVIDSGGKTIGVIANGLDIFYPFENRKVQTQIAETGLLISEYPEGEEAKPWHFPTRNRIISALSDAVIVVEANTRSGSLITAECAVEQGKEVYAVPGSILSQNSLGTNKLISVGARPLVYVDEVFQDLLKAGIIKAQREIDDPDLAVDMSETERRVVSLLKKHGEIPLEDLSNWLKINMSEVNGIVSVLEIKGIVFCEMGKVMIAKSFYLM